MAQSFEFNGLTAASSSDISQYQNFPTHAYCQEKKTKKQIVLHHTVSGNGTGGDIASWANRTDKVSTTYIISRDGTIQQLFDPDKWAYHLGIKSDVFKQFGVKTSNVRLNSESIGIELDNWGGLSKKGTGEYVTSYKSIIKISDENVINYPNGYRGYNYFEAYPEAQLKSLGKLLIYLCKRYNISTAYHSNMFDQNKEALNQTNGIWSHTSFRSDKSDVHPDPNLIKLLQTIAGVKLPDNIEEITPNIETENSQDVSAGYIVQNNPEPTTPKYVWNNETRTPNGGIENKNKEIVRIFVDPTVEKKIVLDELSISVSDSNLNYKNHKVTDTAGIIYPVIKINDYIISPQEIKYFEIDTSDFLPKIKLVLNLALDKFIYKEMPKDGDIISIAIRPTSDTLTPIRNDYVILSAYSTPKSTSYDLDVTTMTLMGELFIPYIQSDLMQFGFIGTSKEAIRDIAIRLGLGFATNDEENTNDKQTWLCCINSPLNYISDVTKRAWKDDKSFYKTWIDCYYNLNFINVNKFLIAPENGLDITVMTHNLEKGFYWGEYPSQDNTKLLPKIFTNFKTMDSTPFYIKKWQVMNRSTSITFSTGTEIETGFFSHNQNLYNANQQQIFNIANVPCYQEDKLNSYILLRGRAKYDPSINTNEQARANYDYKDYIRSPWMGIQYTMSDVDAYDSNNSNNTWSGNCHKNYSRSWTHNYINNMELEKITLHINVSGQNLNVLKGEKVPVLLTEKNPFNAQYTNPDPSTNNPDLNRFYSGWYIILGSKISWDPNNNDGNNNYYNNFVTSYVLGRREWPTPEEIKPMEIN